MQKRHSDRLRYFLELGHTTEEYIIPYIASYMPVKSGIDVLEIGCGEGGNLRPFATVGCNVTGIDISSDRIGQARDFFLRSGLHGDFIASDIFKHDFKNKKFDIIICHDVFEHIDAKAEFLRILKENIRTEGIVYVAFPLWQMPFGGHQQICKNGIVSSLPFIHLLPVAFYQFILRNFKESETLIKELLDIRKTKVTVESFHNLVNNSGLQIRNELFWFVNPHYKEKFGLPPCRLFCLLTRLIHVRNFFTTSFWCILKCP